MAHGREVDLHAVTDYCVASGVEDGGLLLRFAEAVVGDDDDRLERARRELVEGTDEATMIDAAAVASNFQRMVRIASSTGIPLGNSLEANSAEIRCQLGLDTMEPR